MKQYSVTEESAGAARRYNAATILVLLALALVGWFMRGTTTAP